MPYRSSIELAAGTKPKNNGTFPLMHAHDVYYDDDYRVDDIILYLLELLRQQNDTIEALTLQINNQQTTLNSIAANDVIQQQRLGSYESQMSLFSSSLLGVIGDINALSKRVEALENSTLNNGSLDDFILDKDILASDDEPPDNPSPQPPDNPDPIQPDNDMKLDNGFALGGSYLQ